MADVKIRKIPDWVVSHHRRNAEKIGHSLEEELQTVLTDCAPDKRRYWDRGLTKLRDGIQRKHGLLPDSTLAIRADRERLG